jgi:uncharacterized membrane protein HdeD (DUF308 family)
MKRYIKEEGLFTLILSVVMYFIFKEMASVFWLWWFIGFEIFLVGWPLFWYTYYDRKRKNNKI